MMCDRELYTAPVRARLEHLALCWESSYSSFGLRFDHAFTSDAASRAASSRTRLDMPDYVVLHLRATRPATPSIQLCTSTIKRGISLSRIRPASADVIAMTRAQVCAAARRPRISDTASAFRREYSKDGKRRCLRIVSSCRGTVQKFNGEAGVGRRSCLGTVPLKPT